jgi:hypothetical protein
MCNENILYNIKIIRFTGVALFARYLRDPEAC